jgi:hypothetical protein
MHSINGAEGLYWCPRCGTLKRSNRVTEGPMDFVFIPKLVERCKKFIGIFIASFYGKDAIYAHWHQTGIEESINIPEERPT